VVYTYVAFFKYAEEMNTLVFELTVQIMKMLIPTPTCMATIGWNLMVGALQSWEALYTINMVMVA